MFTIHCVTKGRHMETDTGKIKKLANRQAANKMIQNVSTNCLVLTMKSDIIKVNYLQLKIYKHESRVSST